MNLSSGMSADVLGRISYKKLIGLSSLNCSKKASQHYYTCPRVASVDISCVAIIVDYALLTVYYTQLSLIVCSYHHIILGLEFKGVLFRILTYFSNPEPFGPVYLLPW